MLKQSATNKVLAGVTIFVCGVIVVYDSLFHFDEELIQAKTKSYSAQRHWNTNYSQSHVYRDGALKYQQEFKNIEALLQPSSLLLSDLATSYHAAASLPVYVANVHRHQGRNWRRQLVEFLDKRYICYMEFEENRSKVADFFKGNSEIKYILVNKDRKSGNRKRDCLAFRSDTLIEQLPKFSTLLWDGEFLNLYSINYPQ